MKEFIDKLISRLEEEISWYETHGCNEDLKRGIIGANRHAIDLVNQLAEEYKGKSNIIDDLKIFLQKKFDYCAEEAGLNLEAECNSEIASYFRNRKELYLDRANIYGEVMREIDRLSKEYKEEYIVDLCNQFCDKADAILQKKNNGWIPCSERLPEVNGWYLVTNELGVVQQQHWGASHWQKLRDEAVTAWQPLPAPYQPKGE